MIPGVFAGAAGSQGAPPSGAHRHWRAYITALAGGSVASAAEFGLRNTVGGGSIATGGVATASSVYSSSYDADKAFDGNPNTLWSGASGSGLPSWLAYDFGTPVTIVQVALTARHDSAANQTWRDFVIQCSDDGAQWDTAWAVANQTGWSIGETRIFTRP